MNVHHTIQFAPQSDTKIKSIQYYTFFLVQYDNSIDSVLFVPFFVSSMGSHQEFRNILLTLTTRRFYLLDKRRDSGADLPFRLSDRTTLALVKAVQSYFFNSGQEKLIKQSFALTAGGVVDWDRLMMFTVKYQRT